MSTRFIVGTNKTTNEETKAIEQWLDKSQCAWWHWIDGMWLIIDYNDELTPSSILKRFKQLISEDKNIIVFEVFEADEWAGFGPSGDGDERNMFKWLRTAWIDDSE